MMLTDTLLKKKLESLYKKYNKRNYVHPDPLEFLYAHDNLLDREITGLVASSLAYGRVSGILKSVAKVLNKMTPSPSIFLKNANSELLFKTFAGFKHRFTKGKNLACMLLGAKNIISESGSLYDAFMEGYKALDDNILPAMSSFAGKFSSSFHGSPGFLIPAPEKGSACKRLNLFLRWMVRKDSVDPGGWDMIPAAKLIIPLDTHMFKIGRQLGFTNRKQADMQAAIEITEQFKKITPDDPVKYDFTLTRFGIRNELDSDMVVKRLLDL